MAMEVGASHLSNALEPHEATEDAMAIDDMEAPSDPDAQAAITDFLDFTEYLPSDMARSFTLVEELEQKYVETTASIKQLIAAYQELPAKSAAEPKGTSIIKTTLSEKLNQTICIRALAEAEARRTATNVVRHQRKLFQIQAKLDNLYETFPTAQEEAAAASHTISAQATKVPKITLRLGGDQGGHERSRVKRGPRITVPGEVLAPYEFDWDTLDSDPSITPDEEPITNARASIGGPKKIRLKIPKLATQEKTSRLPRPAGVVGTNVHSAVAGISTTNALAKLQPPPDDAPIGSDHRPWGRLTQFELAKLRKRMKKNAVWQPSTTMINRELTTVGRSLAHYKAAKKEAEDTGKPFVYMWNPPESSSLPLTEGPPPVEQALVETLEEQPIINKGMMLNEQKKAKKESIVATAALEHEESARKLADAARVIGGLFSPLDPTRASEKSAPDSSIAPAPKAPAKAAPRKRKRDSAVEAVASQRESSTQPSKPTITPSTPLPQTPAPAAVLPSAKRPKIETPVPLPPPGIGARISMPVTASRSRAASTANAGVGAALSTISASGQAPSQAPAQTSVQHPAPPVTEMSPIPETRTNMTTASSASSTTTTTAPVPEANANTPVPPPSPRKSSTPILPPTRGKRGTKPGILPTPSPASTAAPPTVPTLSLLPSLPSAPASIAAPPPAAAPPTVPVLSSLPSPPSAPASTAAPPTVPVLSSLPSLPSAPASTAAPPPAAVPLTVPALSSLPSQSSVPASTAAPPTVPVLSSLPSLPSAPASTAAPPTVPAPSSLPSLPSLPSAPASAAAPLPAAAPPTAPVLSSLPSLPSAPAPIGAVSLAPPVEGKSTRSRISNKTPEPRRSSRTPSVRPEPVPARAPTPASSVASVKAGRHLSRGKASSVDPTPFTAAKERPHRTGTANNTPAPEPAASRPSRGRARKPAPGQVANGPSGLTAISVGKRSVAPKTRKGEKKLTKAEMAAAARASAEAGEVEVDEDGNVIPADEARYCFCNRVSFGEMIACENSRCKYEWFHLPCVDLTMETLPGRRQKWYCPECRVALGVGEKGTATAKNGKK